MDIERTTETVRNNTLSAINRVLMNDVISVFIPSEIVALKNGGSAVSDFCAVKNALATGDRSDRNELRSKKKKVLLSYLEIIAKGKSPVTCIFTCVRI